MPQRWDILNYKMSKFTLRIESKQLQKFRYVAEYNARSANRELQILIRKHISEFEKQYGRINDP